MKVRLFLAVLLSGLVAVSQAQSTGPLSVEDRSSRGAAASGGGASGEGLLLLMQQIQQLQQEVQRLNGQVEELRHEQEQARAAERERYLDLDARINALAETSDMPPSPEAETQEQAVDHDPEADRAAYMAARDKLLNRETESAGEAFRSYLATFPQGQFRAFAHFWLGEVYRIQGEPAPEKAMAEFRTVIDDYPDHSQVPSALYKLATLQAETGDIERARVTLNRIVMQYEGSSEARYAKSMLEQL